MSTQKRTPIIILIVYIQKHSEKSHRFVQFATKSSRIFLFSEAEHGVISLVRQQGEGQRVGEETGIQTQLVVNVTIIKRKETTLHFTNCNTGK